MDLESLWKSACMLMEKKMNYLAYTTWVQDNLYPVVLEDDTLIIGAKMEPLIPMIQKKYLSIIENCLSESEGKALKALILGKNEADHRLTKTNKSGGDDTDPHLNPKYTINSFIVGDNNRFARAAALAAAESPGDVYNPLFIYGGVGLGKTHLMQAIGNYVHENNPEKRILYMTSETFMNEMINAIQQKSTYEFRAKLRMVDVLLVDDIQFIAGREATQQEFFNSSRFEWGLVADIQAPDEETRNAILREKVRQEKFEVPDEVISMIAREIKSNVRELEGCLTRLVAYSNMTQQPITLELSQTALKEIIDSRKVKIITAEMIMQSVSDYYNVTLSEMVGPTRKREITIPRQVAIYLTREMTGMSLPQIGTVFGGRDHTTILHSCKVMENTVRDDPGMRNLVNSIKRQIESAR